MDITVSKKQGRVSVAVLGPAGILDGSNHAQLEAEAKKIYLSGMRDLIIDLRKLTYMNSSGLGAIHKIARLFGDPPEAGEGSGRPPAVDRQHGLRVSRHVKLLSPQPRVAEILYIASFDALFKIHTNLDAAVASF